MTADHTHPDYEARLAALERENMEDADAGDKLEARIAALEAQMREHTHVHTDDGWRLGTSGAPVQSSDHPIHESPHLRAAMDEAQSAAPDADEAADALPDDLSAAINAARDGEITDEHVGTMLHYLKVDAAEIAALRDQLRAANTGREAAAEEYRSQIAALRAKLQEQLDITRRMHAQAKIDEADRDRLAAQVEGLTRERDAIQAEREREYDNVLHERKLRVQAQEELARISPDQRLAADKLALVAYQRDTLHCERDSALADLALANDVCAEKQAAIEKFLCGEQAADAEIARLKADLAAMTDSHVLFGGIPVKCSNELRVNLDIWRMEAVNENAKLRRELAAMTERAEAGRLALCKLSSAMGNPCVISEVNLEDGVATEAIRWLNECDAASSEADALRGEVERLKGVMSELHRWADAYPISVFKEPDFAKAAKVLGEHGMTLDALSASTMRMMTGDLRRRIRAAGVEVE